MFAHPVHADVAAEVGEPFGEGAAVGSVVGLGLGAAKAVEKGGASVAGCVRDKGYALRPG